jgi:hypothetical protein
MSDDNDKQEEDEMIPFFSIASRDFKDLIILKKFYINLTKERTRKMLNNSVKWQH